MMKMGLHFVLNFLNETPITLAARCEIEPLSLVFVLCFELDLGNGHILYYIIYIHITFIKLPFSLLLIALYALDYWDKMYDGFILAFQCFYLVLFNFFSFPIDVLTIPTL